MKNLINKIYHALFSMQRYPSRGILYGISIRVVVYVLVDAIDIPRQHSCHSEISTHSSSTRASLLSNACLVFYYTNTWRYWYYCITCFTIPYSGDSSWYFSLSTSIWVCRCSCFCVCSAFIANPTKMTMSDVGN